MGSLQFKMWSQTLLLIFSSWLKHSELVNGLFTNTQWSWWRPLCPSLPVESVPITQKTSGSTSPQKRLVWGSWAGQGGCLINDFLSCLQMRRVSWRPPAGLRPGPWSWCHNDQEDITAYLDVAAPLFPPFGRSPSSCHTLLLLLLVKSERHIHEGSIINQSGFGWLPDGWVIIAIIDTGWYEPCYLGLMLLEFRSLTPSYHLVPWWIVLGKVVCTDTHLLPLILCTLLALLRLLPPA